MRKPIKTRKHRARKNRVRKHKVRKYKTRKYKVRKHKTRKRKVRKHKTRKHKGGGEGQPQESQSDCALTCKNYKVGDTVKYLWGRMGRRLYNKIGTIKSLYEEKHGDVTFCWYVIKPAEGPEGVEHRVPCGNNSNPIKKIDNPQI